MNITEEDFQAALNKAECDGVNRARNTLIFIYKNKAYQEKDSNKKSWYEQEVNRLSDDDKWNQL